MEEDISYIMANTDVMRSGIIHHPNNPPLEIMTAR
jgi:hypothetical protein